MGDDVRPRVGTRPEVGEAIGEDRRSEHRSQASQGGRPARGVEGAADEERPAGTDEALGEGADGRTGQDPRPDEDLGVGRRLGVGLEGAHRHERFSERPVHVDRPGWGRDGRRHRPGGDPADVGLGRRPDLGDRQLAEPLHLPPVEMELVDGLVRPPVPELGRPVGGEDDERDPRLAGLGHGRPEVHGRGARGREEDDGPPGRPSQAETEVGRRPLVEMDEDPKPWVAAQGEGERRRPRTRTDDGLADARPDEGLDEGAQRLGRRHGRPSRATGPLTAPRSIDSGAAPRSIDSLAAPRAAGPLTAPLRTSRPRRPGRAPPPRPGA